MHLDNYLAHIKDSIPVTTIIVVIIFDGGKYRCRKKTKRHGTRAVVGGQEKLPRKQKASEYTPS